jgi:LysR family transcriptional regulator, low CO2-responsive transcriptional regulator
MSGLQNVTIRQLRVFAAVVDAGGFGAASERLDIAQTSVSAHIQAIEEQLGQPVFLRRPGRTPVLTEIGTALLGHARAIVAEVDALTSRLGAKQRLFDEQIVFACQRPIADSVLPPVLARFALEHPTVELVTRVGTQEEVMALVQDGSAAIGCLISNDEIPNVISEALGTERCVLIAGRQHPLAGRDLVGPREVERFPFVGAPESSLYGRSVDRMMRDIGIERMTVVSRATEYQVLRQLVIAGVGIACVTEKRVARDVAAGDIVVLPLGGAPLTMTVRLLRSASKRPSPALQSFIEQIRSCWPKAA